ncbi:MAG: polymer-forming cytoskeletal protein [Vicinamibacterales bacterium]|jgi:cytoskeletal protein CcmA (bactofilin family)|nr:polymer-forming cytoskeletal protein [Vicinamibacterales bacterium]MDP7478652.1 polymer-forming cytoskeletal protein [Vicinamibacterales bacterium]MDP7692893.1 polymer-forming cytoskeletal protein [Vicinamibacterales bacterium]HJN44815.1 polymer-forming cytoskeletal protein [Vicinamibacterales bacterium]
MWKREEAAKPVSPAAAASVTGAGVGASRAGGRVAERDVVNIGKSVVIKGELSGSEDLTIEGQVEGKIELKQHVLTIGPHGRIRAGVFAKSVIVLGEVFGDIKATDKVAIRDNGSVEGDITAPKVAIAEGARFRGGIDMQQGARPKGEERPAAEVKPQPQPQHPQVKATSKAPQAASPGGN